MTLQTTLAGLEAHIPFTHGQGAGSGAGGNDPIKRPTRAVAIATMARALRGAASSLGYNPSDTLIALMLAQMVGAEGAMPGLWDGAGYTLRGTNNIGAAQVPGAQTGPAFMSSHKNGWGAFAHRDSNPGGDAYIGWYYIAPTAQDAAQHWLTGYGATTAALQQEPQDPQSYAALMYAHGYYTGTSSDAQTDIDRYASAISRALPEVQAAMGGPSNDPTLPSVDPTLFASLSARQITQDLYNKAVAGQSGSAWKYLLPSWAALQASSGVVWFGSKPSAVTVPWKSALALGAAGAVAAGPVGLAAGLAVAAGWHLLSPHVPLPSLRLPSLPVIRWPWSRT